MSLVVVDPGLESRIVDFGRPRSRSLGVPVGGAADRHSLAIANALLGNAPDAPALEVALRGPRLRADADVACVIFGAPFEIEHNRMPVDIGHVFTLLRGDELRILGTPFGVRAYLCVCGGFEMPIVLGSRSSLEPIRADDELPCRSSAMPSRYCAEIPRYPPKVWTLSVLPGLQSAWFDEAEFYQQIFTAAPASNRMGVRLQGVALTMPDREMISEAVCPGAIQVTRDGQGILLGVDGQTIGGYPKIAQVTQADLDAIGQLRPGQRVRFHRATMQEAVRRDRETAGELAAKVLRLHLSLDALTVARRFSVS